MEFEQQNRVAVETQTKGPVKGIGSSKQKEFDQQVHISSQHDTAKTLMTQFQQLFSSMEASLAASLAASLEKTNTQMQEFQKLIEARPKKSNEAIEGEVKKFIKEAIKELPTMNDGLKAPPAKLSKDLPFGSPIKTGTKGVTEQIEQGLTNSNAKKKDSDQELLEKAGEFLSTTLQQQKDMLTAVNESLGKIKPLERDSLLTATTGVMSALGNGISVKSAAKAGGAVLGVGIVGTLGGCLAYAAAKAAAASPATTGVTVEELGDALKETMEQVFPEALIAIAAAALLAVIAKMVYDAMQNAAKKINSTDTETRLYKAQEKMQKAQTVLASHPLDIRAHKEMESAIKDMIDLGSQKVFTDKNGKKMGDPQALLESDQLKSLKEALAKTTQLKNHAKLQTVYKLVHGDKGGDEYKSSSNTQQFKNAFKPTQTNTDKLEKLMMKMGIADKITTPSVSTTATMLKANEKSS